MPNLICLLVILFYPFFITDRDGDIFKYTFQTGSCILCKVFTDEVICVTAEK